MYHIIPIIILLSCTIVGLLLGIKAFQESKKIYFGEKGTSKEIIKNSVLSGISVSLIMMAVIQFLGLSDIEYNFELKSLFFQSIFSLAVGIIVFFGSLWGFFAVGKYRKLLEQIIQEKINKKK